MAQNRVLVLGGTQFIGVHIVRELLSAYEVTLLNRGITPSPFEGDPRVRQINADRFEDRDAVSEAIRSYLTHPWVAFKRRGRHASVQQRDLVALFEQLAHDVHTDELRAA